MTELEISGGVENPLRLPLLVGRQQYSSSLRRDATEREIEYSPSPTLLRQKTPSHLEPFVVFESSPCRQLEPFVVFED
jgi:hypothetical protein